MRYDNILIKNKYIILSYPHNEFKMIFKSLENPHIDMYSQEYKSNTDCTIKLETAIQEDIKTLKQIMDNYGKSQQEPLYFSMQVENDYFYNGIIANLKLDVVGFNYYIATFSLIFKQNRIKLSDLLI